MVSKDASWENQVDPPSSGEDSDENHEHLKKAFPSVRQVVKNIDDSQKYVPISDENANELMEQYRVPVNIMFMNLNDNFRKKNVNMNHPNQRGNKKQRHWNGKEPSEAQNFKKYVDSILNTM